METQLTNTRIAKFFYKYECILATKRKEKGQRAEGRERGKNRKKTSLELMAHQPLSPSV